MGRKWRLSLAAAALATALTAAPAMARGGGGFGGGSGGGHGGFSGGGSHGGFSGGSSRGGSVGRGSEGNHVTPGATGEAHGSSGLHESTGTGSSGAPRGGPEGSRLGDNRGDRHGNHDGGLHDGGGHHRHHPGWPYGGYPYWGFGLGLGFYDPFYEPYSSFNYDNPAPEQSVEGEDVEVKVHPSSAHIVVNGIEYGHHGKARFRLPSGTWTVVLEAPGYEPQTIQLDIEPGRGYTIERHLVKVHDQ